MAQSRGHNRREGRSSGLGNGREPNDARRRQLRRLQSELGELREALLTVRTQTQTLWETEAVRPLTDAEAKQARALSREAERLRWELRRLRNEFGLLQGSQGVKDVAPDAKRRRQPRCIH